MTLTIIVIPFFSILVTVFAFVLTLSVGRYESEELSAPRYLQSVLMEILTTGKVSKEGFSGVIMVFNDQGKMIYADPLVNEFIDEQNWDSLEDGYQGIMAEMPPSQPFSVSIYSYRGKPGVILFVEDFFTRIKLFRILGIVLFGLYFILIVLPVLMLRIFMRPLQETLISLERAAGEIGRGNLDVVVFQPRVKNRRRRHTHPMALEGLVTAFDRMRIELKENHERQSRIMMSVSHDLKTPLTLIKGYVEVLKDGMAETPEDVIQYAEVIHDRANLLEERISDLIHFSKLQTTDWQARFLPIPFKEFLEETAIIFKNDTFIRKREFEYSINITPDILIRGDRKMLFQVLENIFDNSCRYSEDGSRIRFSTELEQGAIILRLEDSGPGIQDKHIPYIFDNYYRADSGRNSHGSGMGLASAKTIIRNHGGDVEYMESSLGGAGFRIVLPVYVESS